MIKIKVLVIIPAYNEAENIKNVLERLEKICPQYDYIVVNDCSKDDTRAILYEHRANYLSLPINLGIGGCMQAGYLYAYEHGYDITVQLDGDGQHDPKYISSVIDPVVKGQADMVIGSRFLVKQGFQSSFMRRFGIKWLSGVIRLCCGKRFYDVTSGFRASSKPVIKYFSENYAQDFPEPEAIVSCVLNGFRVLEVPVIMNERTGGRSSIIGIKTLYFMVKVTLSLFITRFSIKKVR